MLYPGNFNNIYLINSMKFLSYDKYIVLIVNGKKNLYAKMLILKDYFNISFTPVLFVI